MSSSGVKASLKQFKNYTDSLLSGLSDAVEFVRTSRQYRYELSGWEKGRQREEDRLVFRVTATDKYITTKTVLDIYNEDDLLFGFSPQEIKYISSLAVLLFYKKESRYEIVWRSFRNKLNTSLIKVKDRFFSKHIISEIKELEKDISIIDGMSGRDAFLLGKESATRDIIRESMLD